MLGHSWEEIKYGRLGASVDKWSEGSLHSVFIITLVWVRPKDELNHGKLHFPGVSEKESRWLELDALEE